MALLMGLMAQLYREALVVLKPTIAFIAARAS
jgi:hypothetical protein